jgi:hypothetical protein
VLIRYERKILVADWWLLAGAELVWEKSTAGFQPNKALDLWVGDSSWEDEPTSVQLQPSERLECFCPANLLLGPSIKKNFYLVQWVTGKPHVALIFSHTSPRSQLDSHHSFLSTPYNLEQRDYKLRMERILKYW